MLCLPKGRYRFHLVLQAESKHLTLWQLWVRTSLVSNAQPLLKWLRNKATYVHTQILLVFSDHKSQCFTCMRWRSGLQLAQNLPPYQNHTHTFNMYPNRPLFHITPPILLFLSLFNPTIAQGPAHSITPTRLLHRLLLPNSR